MKTFKQNETLDHQTKRCDCGGERTRLLQTQADGPGAPYGIDDLALAHCLFDDVAKVFKVLQKTSRGNNVHHRQCI